jgi:PEP-CTERM motif
MTRFLSFLLLFVSFISLPALADGITLFPNSGSGDNFAFVSQMNGHPLLLSGGTDPFFLSADGYPAGMTVGGSGGLFLFSTVIWVDGSPLEFFFDSASIFMTSFTLPTNGRDFIAPVDVNFEASGFNFDTEQRINLSGGDSGWIGFSFSNGLYYPGDFVQGPPPVMVPEPATLGLIGTGLMSIAARATKKRRLDRPRSYRAPTVQR